MLKSRGNKQTKEPRKFLLVQLAKLGDMVCTTPVLTALKKKWPTSQVYVVGNSTNRELLAHSGLLDGYFVFSGRPSISRLINQIKRENFDAAFLISPNFIGLAMLCLSGIPLIVAPRVECGWSPHETTLYKALSYLVEIRPHCVRNYSPREYLRLLEAVGIETEDTRKHLGFSVEANRRIDEILRQSGISFGDDLVVGISPSAGDKIKLWASDKFAKLADYLYEKYAAKLIVIGSQNDEQEVEDMLSHLSPQTKIVSFLNLINLDELNALISKMNVLIAVDTGPIYIAEAFGVATIDLIGPIDENVQSPHGRKHKVVFADVPGRPFMQTLNSKVYDKRKVRLCMDLISVEMVIKSFEELLPEINPR